MPSSTPSMARFTSRLCAVLALACVVGHGDARAASISLGEASGAALVPTWSGPRPRIEESAPIALEGRWYVVRTVYF